MICKGCGQSFEDFRSSGKIRCFDCLEFLKLELRGDTISSRRKQIRQQVSTHEQFTTKLKILNKQFHHSNEILSIRYRISRSIDLGNQHPTKNFEVVNAKQYSDEDQYRFEWIWTDSDQFLEDANLLLRNPQRIEGNEVSSQKHSLFAKRQVWDQHKLYGFVNHCPTNWGRGDRLSLRMFTRISKEQLLGILQSVPKSFEIFGANQSRIVDWNPEKTYLEISVKNLFREKRLLFLDFLAKFIKNP